CHTCVAGFHGMLAFSGLAAISGLSYNVFRTQCFTRQEGPERWDTLSIATPSSTDEAIQRLSVAIASAQPLLFRGGAHEARPGFFGWASDSWAPQELQERFGELKIDGGYDATLSDFLDSFFEGEDPPSPKKSCFSGDAPEGPACTMQGGAPFCTRPCLTNATLNIGIVEDSDPPFEDVLVEMLNSLPLLRWRAQRGEAFGSRVLTSLVPSSVGFAPDADWVEAVLWISPKGARTGLHQDDEPCSVLHQVYGRKRLVLFPPGATHVQPEERPHCLAEHGTRYSKLSLDEIERSGGKALEVVLEPGDAIFIPNAWWHAAEALSPSVSISGRGVTFCEGLSFLQHQLLLPEEQARWLPHLMAITLPLFPLLLAYGACQAIHRSRCCRTT
ncbi:unnamed protein product, partial [Durusdinium trenchii]